MTDDDTPNPWDDTVMTHAVPPVALPARRRCTPRRLHEIEDGDDQAMWADPPADWEP